MGRPGTWQTGGSIALVASNELVTIFFGMGVGIGVEGRTLWDIH